MSAFAEQLEIALSKNESNFINAIKPYIEPLSEEKLNILANVLENGSVVDKRSVATLFNEVLGDIGAVYLTTNLTPKRPKLFTESAEILSKLEFTKAIKPLSNAISTEYQELVLPAIKAISSFKNNKEAIEVLSNFFLTFPDEVKLAKSVRYLVNLKKDLTPILLEKYPNQNDDRKMWLLNYFAEAATEELTQLFKKELEENPLERGLYCLTGLGKIGSDKAVEILKSHILNDEWFFRKHLAAALGETNNKLAVEPLLALLNDASQQVRSAAVDGLSKTGNLNPEALINKLKNCEKSEKANLIRAMGQLKNKLFLNPLLDTLNDRDMLFCSVDALGDLGFVEASEKLKTLLKDNTWFNRLNALEALEKLNPNGITKLASELMQDENDMVRNSASRIYSLTKTLNQ